MITELEALKERHSIRKYQDRQLETDIIAALHSEIDRLNAAGNLHMQLVTNEPKAFKSLLAYGVFSNVSNYIVVAGKRSDVMACRAGYYTECIVLKAQQLGLNTCIVGLTYKKVDGAFELQADEKVYVCVAIGYGAESGRKHKIKTPAEVSNMSADTPQWFANGVEAALLAPTAINQQKFYFGYLPPQTKDVLPAVRPKRIKSLVGYTMIDLGIAMRNFEIGAGPDNFYWIDNPMTC